MTTDARHSATATCRLLLLTSEASQSAAATVRQFLVLTVPNLLDPRITCRHLLENSGDPRVLLPAFHHRHLSELCFTQEQPQEGLWRVLVGDQRVQKEGERWEAAGNSGQAVHNRSWQGVKVAKRWKVTVCSRGWRASERITVLFIFTVGALKCKSEFPVKLPSDCTK